MPIYTNITQTGRIRVYCSWFWVRVLFDFVGFVGGFVGGFGWVWVVLGHFGWFRVLVTTIVVQYFWVDSDYKTFSAFYL